jgi:hypothetical protein
MFLLLCARLGFNWAISSTLLKVSYMYMDEYNEKFGKSFKQLTKTHKGILDYILGTEGCE